MKKSILLLAIIATCNMACSSWLDVAPEQQQKESDLFLTYRGFRDALTGCYMSMADQAGYGERLTITNINSLANLWYMTSSSTRYEDLDLSKHDYNTDYGKDARKAMYSALFNTIAQANVILKNVRLTGEAIPDPATRAIIEGEAHAIRAYCQFDVLRLFGQLPQGATITVELPYSETTSLNEMPRYYGFDEYVSKLKSDVDKALELLKDNDPLFTYSFSALNGTGTAIDDTYLLYRQSRLNYYAVKALQARMCLYLGDRPGAYAAAKELIETGEDDTPILSMSGLTDIPSKYFTLPSECLFYLSKYDVKGYTNYLIGERLTSTGELQQFRTSSLAISADMLQELYAGQDISAHNRYLYAWNQAVADPYAKSFPATLKYWYRDEVVDGLMLKLQIIPMLRMSEVYLIAIETSNDLSEVNALYKAYMNEHDVKLTSDYFTSLADVQAEVLNEYRREFFAEGLMFYAYKRVGATQMLWRDAAVEESEYVLPLPETEYNPNTLNQ